MSKLYKPETIQLISKGNEAFETKLIGTFVKSSKLSIEELEASIATQNNQGIYNASHKVKPSLQYIRANDLFELAKKVEAAAKEPSTNFADIQAETVELKNLLTQLLHQIIEDFKVEE